MNTTTTVPLVEETAEVRKVEVDQGGWRVVKRVSTDTQVVDEELQSENVEIERRPIGQPVVMAPQTRYEGETLVVPVLEEVLVTEKRLVLVEEIRITRVRHTHRQPQTVTLRKDHIEIERLEPDTGSGVQSP